MVKHRNSLIIWVSICFVGLIAFQIYWIYLAAMGEKSHLQKRKEELLFAVRDKMVSSTIIKTKLQTILSQDASDKTIPDSLIQTINLHLNEIVFSNPTQFNLDSSDVGYAIFKNIHNSIQTEIILINGIPDNQQEMAKQHIKDLHFCLSCIVEPHNNHKRTNDSYVFGIFIKNENAQIINKMALLIIISLLFIILLIYGFTVIAKKYAKEVKLASQKNDFINTLTHELQTPLFTIGLTASLIKKKIDPKENEQINDYISIIEKETQQLKEHAVKILELSSLESGELAIGQQLVNLKDIVFKNLPSLQLLASKANGTITTVIDKNKDFFIIGDRTHLSNVLTSLVENSIKYSRQDLLLEISLFEQENKIILSVKDNGIGIERQHLPHIFEKFYRAVPKEINKRGYGLGLSYAKTIVELHKGEISIQSIVGAGTMVQICFPKTTYSDD